MFQDFANEYHHLVLVLYERILILKFTGISELFCSFLLPHRKTIECCPHLEIEWHALCTSNAFGCRGLLIFSEN